MTTLAYIFDGGSGRPLSPKAQQLARYLMDHPNRIHKREDMATACGFEGHGRASDTYMSEIRKGLGTIDRIVSSNGYGYGWMGDPVPLVAVAKGNARTPSNDEMMNFAVMTRGDVARALGITKSAVGSIERKALAKLRKKPELKKAWGEMLMRKSRLQYDPFHEIWLYQVADKITYQPVEENNEDPE